MILIRVSSVILGFLLSTLPLLAFFILSNIYYYFRKEEPRKEFSPKDFSANDLYNRRQRGQKILDNKRIISNRSGREREQIDRDPFREAPRKSASDYYQEELPSCFNILGFSDLPSKDELKSKYRELARLHHPDRGGDPRDFEEITKAYDEARKYFD